LTAEHKRTALLLESIEQKCITAAKKTLLQVAKASENVYEFCVYLTSVHISPEDLELRHAVPSYHYCAYLLLF
jgi:hypothetical protein